jgi:transposase
VVIRRGAQQAHVVALAGDDRLKQEFLDFMNRVVAQHDEGREIHVILDNLNTHRPKNDRWLKRHPNVHFHFTPTRASWLNQVEIWFSILAGKALRGASFNSLGELKAHIATFIESYTETARRSCGPRPRSIRNASSQASRFGETSSCKARTS